MSPAPQNLSSSVHTPPINDDTDKNMNKGTHGNKDSPKNDASQSNGIQGSSHGPDTTSKLKLKPEVTVNTPGVAPVQRNTWKPRVEASALVPPSGPFNFNSSPLPNASLNGNAQLFTPNTPQLPGLGTPPQTLPAASIPSKDATAIQVPKRPETDGAVREDLRLTPVYLVQNASETNSFSLDGILIQHTGTEKVFSIEALAAGIAQGCTVEGLRQYLDSFTRNQVEQEIGGFVKDRHPILFYAAARNCVQTVKLLIEYGCEANVEDADGIPCLAFSVMISKWTLHNPAEVVQFLVAFGAMPHDIPTDMWLKYLETPSVKPSSKDLLVRHPAAKWCTHYHRQILASTLNLSIRYYLHKAAQMTHNKARALQVAKAHGCTALLKVPYLLIGQNYATKYVVTKVFSHIAMGNKTPLVLTFAGLSGHGKTELAKQMGSLLNVPMTVIDCAQMHSDIALFGSRTGYRDCEKGSQLNNHLAAHTGQRNVVFMDEFDKTDKEVHNSLLLVLDSGEFHDRRTNKPVDASKTIWVMATNLGDKNIEKFYRDKLEDVTYANRTAIEDKEGKTLAKEIRRLFGAKFGAPMAGRMKNIAPFFPLNKDEQAVVVHKFLMELVEDVRKPIDLSPIVKRYPGHIRLAVKNDGKLCELLAAAYIQELGARSLVSPIDDIRSEFFTAFVDTDELVTEEMNKGAMVQYTVQLRPVAGDESEVAVMKDGFTTAYKGYATEAEAEQEYAEDAVAKALSAPFAKMMR